MATLFKILLCLTVIVAPQERLGKRIHVLIDASGSMEHKYDAALEAMRLVLENDSDEYYIKVGAFVGSTTWFSEEWIRMPDAEKLGEIRVWLEERRPTDKTAGTRMNVRGLSGSLVLITDGHIHGNPLAQLRSEDLLVTAIGLGPTTKLLRNIGREFKGGYYKYE